MAIFSFDFFKKCFILIVNFTSKTMALKDITLGQFYAAKSIVHRCDPRSKIIASLFLMTGLLMVDTASSLILFSMLVFSGIYFSNIPLDFFLKNLKPFLWFILFTFGVHSFFTTGTVLLDLKIFEITKEGLINGTLFSARFVLLILLTGLLTFTTSPLDLTDGLEKLLSPLKKIKLPVQEFVLMLTLTLRFIPILIAEVERLKNAQLSRGISFNVKLTQRIRNIGSMILPLVISSIQRADELAIAMESRNYLGGASRSSYRILNFAIRDHLLVGFSVGLFTIQFFFTAPG